MIDHVSIGVKDIDKATNFYQPILNEIGLIKLIEKSGTVGFGKNTLNFGLIIVRKKIQILAILEITFVLEQSE